MRLFLALNPTPSFRDALLHVQHRLDSEGVQGRYTSEENLHLTLAFIGEYPDPDEVLEALASVAFSPFPLTLEGIGTFGDLWWAGVASSPALDTLARRVRRALAENDIPFDRKKFSPHLTLLRKAVATADIPEIQVPAVTMNVDHFSLMRSDRGKHGMIYTELGAISCEINP